MGTHQKSLLICKFIQHILCDLATTANMKLKNTSKQYGVISQLLHWTVAVLFFMQFIWAWRIEQLGLGRQRYDLVNQHKSIGMTILVLVVMRLLWRQINVIPAYVPPITFQQRIISRYFHYLLYSLLLMIPITGWLMSSAAGFVVSWFGLIDLPSLIAQDDNLKKLFKLIHAILALSAGLIVLVHIVAALYHHFVKRDNTMKRMLP